MAWRVNRLSVSSSVSGGTTLVRITVRRSCVAHITKRRLTASVLRIAAFLAVAFLQLLRSST